MPDKTELAINSSISRQNVAKEGWTTYYIDGTNGNDGANGLTWESAFKTIQHAIDTAESWAKIYVKAGTYTEDVTCAKEHVTIKGEKNTTTIVQGVAGAAIWGTADSIVVQDLTCIGIVGTPAAQFDGDYCEIQDVIIGDPGILGSLGVWLAGDRNLVNNVKCTSANVASLIIAQGDRNEIRDVRANTVDGVIWITGSNNKIYENDIIACTTNGVQIDALALDNIVTHNNFVNMGAVNPIDNYGGVTNKFWENYYSTHVVDTNNDGLADTPMDLSDGVLLTTGMDYQPVSTLNRWNQASLGYESGADGGGTYGSREIFDSFEQYIDDAALQAVWIKEGEAGDPTKSATAFYGQYAMQVVIGAGGVGNVYRIITSKDFSPIANITIAARSAGAGNSFRLTLWDGLGNWAYWTRTITIANTWYDFEVNVHSAPTAISATPVDLTDIVKIDLRNMAANETYLFDLITFEGLISSDIEEINYGSYVYVDDGGTNSTDYPYGTPTHPTSTIANGLTIAAALNLHRLHIHGTFGAITETLSGYWIEGKVGPLGSPFLTLAAGVANAGTIFNHCMITGAANGWATYENDCLLLNLTGVQGLIRDSNLYGTIKLGSGITDFDFCTTIGGPITIDLDDIAAGTCIIHNFTGTITLTNLDTAGTVKIYSSTGANVTIAASCTAGGIELFGNCNVTDLSAGAVVVQHTINTEVQQVFDLANAILVTTETGGVVSTNGAAEVDVYINDAPAGVYKPRILKIWFTNQTAGETVVIREKYRIADGDALEEVDEETFAGVQDPVLIIVDLDPTRFGVAVTIAKTAGADRGYKWEVIYDI